MCKIAIIGYGKMGKEVERILTQEHIAVTAIIDNEADWVEKREQWRQCDVAIEFSTPATVVANLKRCIEAQIPVVCGTTGWESQQAEIIQLCKVHSSALIYGSNFSIGANLFFKVNELLAQMMNKQTRYDVQIEEIHHTAKLDIPSGTAITTANVILPQLDRKDYWTLDAEPAANAIRIEALRVGNETGTHTVQYRSANDQIKITHQAFNRIDFAGGAVKAALWLTQHHGVYAFKDIFMEV